ncbi:MAG: DNA repair protein RecO C-terminal domain-containing protein [Paludibacteraceae bacterium]|nr:DNA repair protein RecO C-terminal domain-containing protein [Paludibacteraceae bacterium]
MRSTQAIVLHLQKHSDKVSLLHLYALDSGRITCAVYSKKYANILQPMSLVDLAYELRPNQTMGIIKSVSLQYVPQQTNIDMRRYSVALFISEILYRVLLHPLYDEGMFVYLSSVIKELDQTSYPENIHLRFLLHLTNYLGIMPEWIGEGNYLDMQLGEQRYSKPMHDDYFTHEELVEIQALYNSDNRVIGRKMRQQLLDKLCRYYELHLPEFQTPKALSILKEIFD